MDLRTNLLAWLVTATVGIIGAGLSCGPASAQGTAQFEYRVNHSVFGDIGTYTNTVEPTKDGTTVKTRAHFEVKMLGVKMYREDADRTERWPQLALAYDLDWLTHDTDKHKGELVKILSEYITRRSMPWRLEVKFDLRPFEEL